MDENYNSNPDQGQQGDQQYTDPNAGTQYTGSGQNQGYNYNQNYNQNYGQSYGQNYSQNYGPGGNGGYNPQQYGGMDTSPMSMGDWVLTILALMIPCAGIILYFVWAFGRNGNINRRNYCRAALVIEAVVIILTIVVSVAFGTAIFSADSYY